MILSFSTSSFSLTVLGANDSLGHILLNMRTVEIDDCLIVYITQK